MNPLKYLFSFACFAATFGMTIFWCYKYWIDDDLCLVDYKSFDESTNKYYPMVSMCLSNCLIDASLKSYNQSYTEKDYIEYLKGGALIDGMDKVDLNNVTPNLEDYLFGHFIKYKNGSSITRMLPNVTDLNVSGTMVVTNISDLSLEVTYSGFYYGHIIKCFGLTAETKDVRAIYFAFNTSIFPSGNRWEAWDAKMSLILYIHLPNKLLLSCNRPITEWPKRQSNRNYVMKFQMDQIEVLRRRNKRKEMCVSDDVDYDKKILDYYLEEIGCRAPYHSTSKNTSVCSSKEAMSRTMFNISAFPFALKHACTSIENINYKYREYDTDDHENDRFWIGLTYPEKFKDINQVRAVDIQTVIGNAGGYVGLFLGMLVVKYSIQEASFFNLTMLGLLFPPFQALHYYNFLNSLNSLGIYGTKDNGIIQKKEELFEEQDPKILWIQ